jgi:Arc/MetJ-type ribon-helix-helix transcriptional regulator
MEVLLDPEIEKVVLQKVARGEYPSVAIMIEEALYLLVERDWSQSQADLQQRMPSVFDLEPETSPEIEGKLP